MLRFSKSLLFTLLLLIISAASCSESYEQGILNRAEALMEAHPDSAMALLSSIDKQRLTGNRQKAHYALLMSMALDKNYIDTTSFDVLQPAIDYYLRKGSPDEKLRTYYYQGRIFQNKGDRDNALNAFVKGIDVSHLCSDSLSIARTLVAQALLYYEFYDLTSYTENYIQAANIYNSLSLNNQEFDCLINALNGSIILYNRSRADSLIDQCNKLGILNNNKFNQRFQGRILAYFIQFGSKHDIEDWMEQQEGGLTLNPNNALDLAMAYNKLGDNNKAIQILKILEDSKLGYDTLKYESIAVGVFKEMDNYKEAFSTYWDFSHRWDSINAIKFDQKAASIKEKHQIELMAQNESQRHSRIIWGCIGGIVVLSMGLFILILLFRSKKANEKLALEKARSKEAENAKLKAEKDMVALENERYELENKNLQLEMDKKALEAENLAHRVTELENESESLKALIDVKEELPQEVQDTIKIRIEMLNSLLASHITDNDQYVKQYDSWVMKLTEDSEGFMNSNRLAFQASHPHFIQYFEDHDLTVEEINYVCLYAIGLRGKEVGNYMKKRSHVNTSSAIRKKLGIDKHETNIGIYVRKLLKSL